MCYVAVGYKYNMHSMKELQTTRRNQEYRTAIKCSPLSLNRTGSHSGAPSWQIGQCQAPRSPKNLPDPHVCTIHLYFNTPPHVQAPLGFKYGKRSQLQLFLFNCSTPRFELKTSRSIIILNCMHQPTQPKNLS